MDILVVDPGSDYSTSDVHDGLVAGLRAAGATVHEYHLAVRRYRTASWLRHCWLKSGKPDGLYTDEAVIYQSSADAIGAALEYDVPWVIVVSGAFFHPDVLTLLRRAGRRVGVLFTESPYDSDHELEYAALADVVWTNERSMVEAFQRVNPRASYLPHAWHPTRHGPAGPADETVEAHDVVFVGTAFRERMRLLAGVDWTGINLGLYGLFERMGRRHPLRAFVRPGPVPNDRSAALYRRAKIGLNLYRTSAGSTIASDTHIAHAESLNPRAYELAACGCFQLSTWRAEVPAAFGTLVPTFGTAQELEGLIRFWLAHDPERQAIRQALPSTVAGQSWRERAQQVLADLTRVSAAAARAA